MDAKPLRIQLISDEESLKAVSRAAAAEGITTEPTEIPKSDQRFGLVEAAAIAAIVHSSVQVAKLLAEAYKHVRGGTLITLKTPRGTVTIDANSETDANTIHNKLKEANIM